MKPFLFSQDSWFHLSHWGGWPSLKRMRDLWRHREKPWTLLDDTKNQPGKWKDMEGPKKQPDGSVVLGSYPNISQPFHLKPPVPRQFTDIADWSILIFWSLVPWSDDFPDGSLETFGTTGCFLYPIISGKKHAEHVDERKREQVDTSRVYWPLKMGVAINGLSCAKVCWLFWIVSMIFFLGGCLVCKLWHPANLLTHDLDWDNLSTWLYQSSIFWIVLCFKLLQTDLTCCPEGSCSTYMCWTTLGFCKCVQYNIYIYI